MKETQGRNGGRLKTMEKGDPSPNKGKHRPTTSSLLAVWKREKREKLSRDKEQDTICFALEMTPDELIKLINTGKLPVWLAVELKGWLDKRNGVDNVRRSKERVFGKSAESETNIYNHTSTYVLSEQGTIDAMEEIKKRGG